MVPGERSRGSVVFVHMYPSLGRSHGAMHSFVRMQRFDFRYITVVSRQPPPKKMKGLPGDKISELKNMDTDQMLSLLVENRLVSTPAPRRVSDFIGDFNYLGYILPPPPQAPAHMKL